MSAVFSDVARLRDLADRYGTPLFVYDAEVADGAWRALRSALPSRVGIAYSVKANPMQRLLRFFVERGCGLEVASGGELHQALAAGCDASRIVYAGPGKTDAELHAAVSAGIAEIHVESLGELSRLADLGRRRGSPISISLRVNPTGVAEGGALRMGGRSTPFGIDEEEIDRAVDAALAEPAVALRGVHVFSGTQILDADVLLAQHRKAVAIGRYVAQRARRPLGSLDLGGGLGVPYFSHERPLDLGAIARGWRRLESTIAGDPLLDGARVVIEPGRFLAGPAGLYVTSVVDVKRSRGKHYVVVDGGLHHHLAASGNLGQTIKRNFPIAALDHPGVAPSTTVDVVGPLCTPLDVLARGVEMPAVRVGDLIGVYQSGAYARSASPLGFLSHPTPPEVWVDGGVVRLARRRGRLTDALADQVPAGASGAEPARVGHADHLEIREP